MQKWLFGKGDSTKTEPRIYVPVVVEER